MKVFTAPTQHDRPFHQIKPYYASASIEHGLNDGRLIEDDVHLINEYIAELQASQGIGDIRVLKITSHLVNWRRFIGPYRTNTIADIYGGIAVLKTANSQRGKPFKQNSLHDYVLFIKRFYLWLIENGYSDVPKVKIQKIKPPRVERNTKLPEQLLSKSDVNSIIQACYSSRDRALVALLYESGCRIGELARLSWERLQFDKYGVVLTIEDTKCHQQRYVRLVMALPYISSWRNDYPHTPEGNALVFITKQNTPLAHGTVYQLLFKLGVRAGIKKRVTPHLFRHSRITHLINEGMKESVIKLMMWGNINTDMFATYAHITGKDIDNEVLRQYGIAQEEEQEQDALEPIQCTNCQTINAPNTNYCAMCGLSLSEEAIEIQEQMNMDVLSNPETLKRLLNELIEEKMGRGEI
jgi:integrase/recombinase XerD